MPRAALWCTLSRGYLAATLLLTVAPASAPSRRYALIAAMATVVSALACLIGGLEFAAYTGSFGRSSGSSASGRRTCS